MYIPVKKNITFEPIEHKYTDDEGNVYLSATQLIGQLEPKFDTEFWGVFTALKRFGYKPYPNPKDRTICPNPRKNKTQISLEELLSYGKLYSMYNDVIQEWELTNEKACNRGNEIHDYLESCIKKYQKDYVKDIGDLVDKNHNKDYYVKITNLEELESSSLKYLHPEIYQYLAVHINNGWVIYGEKRIYLYEYLVSGTIDVVLVKGKDIKIVDWKTNKDKIKYVSGYYKTKMVKDRDTYTKIKTDEWVETDDRLNNPLSHLPACKGSIYTIQTSLYAYMLECWGYKCKDIVIFHIRPNEEGEEIVERHNISYRKKDVIALLNYRKSQI